MEKGLLGCEYSRRFLLYLLNRVEHVLQSDEFTRNHCQRIMNAYSKFIHLLIVSNISQTTKCTEVTETSRKGKQNTPTLPSPIYLPTPPFPLACVAGVNGEGVSTLSSNPLFVSPSPPLPNACYAGYLSTNEKPTHSNASSNHGYKRKT